MSVVLVAGAVVLVSFVAVVVVLETARRSPITTTDLYCAALDERLAGAEPAGAPHDAPAAARDAASRSSRTGRSSAARGARSPGVAV